VRPAQRQSSGTAIGRTSFWVFAGGLAILFLFPLLWTAVASVSPDPATAQQDGYGFGNYETLVDYDAGLPQYLWNSTYVSALTVLFTLLLSVLGGYAFARFRFFGRDALFLLVIAILMVPYATVLIPLWVLFGELGLRNSLFGVALVLTLYQLPFAMFMMRISFEAVPRELEESALVDGCGTLGVLRWILLYAVWPGMLTVGLFAFLFAWNDFIAPLFLITDNERYPLPLAMATIRQQTMGAVDFGVTEAGVVVMALPCLLLFLILQRHYVRGFMSGALKG
jgi:multiple sugar transport system permease protein